MKTKPKPTAICNSVTSFVSYQSLKHLHPFSTTIYYEWILRTRGSRVWANNDQIFGMFKGQVLKFQNSLLGELSTISCTFPVHHESMTDCVKSTMDEMLEQFPSWLNDLYADTTAILIKEQVAQKMSAKLVPYEERLVYRIINLPSYLEDIAASMASTIRRDLS